MLRIFLPVLIAGLLLGHTPLATAEDGVVYRWRDAAGEMHFDQIPPRGVPYDIISPSGAKATELTPSGNKINKSGLSGDTEAFLERAQAEREAKEKAKAAEKQAKLKAERQCKQARERHQFLEERTARRLVVKADDGNYARLEEDEFLKRLNDAQQAIDQYCK